MLLSDAHRRRFYQILSPILRINVGLKTILRQGLADPEFYGDLVYIFKKIIGRTIFSDLLKKFNTLQTCWLQLKCDAAVQPNHG